MYRQQAVRLFRLPLGSALGGRGHSFSGWVYSPSYVCGSMHAVTLMAITLMAVTLMAVAQNEGADAHAQLQQCSVKPADRYIHAAMDTSSVYHEVVSDSVLFCCQYLGVHQRTVEKSHHAKSGTSRRCASFMCCDTARCVEQLPCSAGYLFVQASALQLTYVSPIQSNNGVYDAYHFVHFISLDFTFNAAYADTSRLKTHRECKCRAAMRAFSLSCHKHLICLR